MIDINDYMKRPLSERQSHIREDEPCIERGGFSTYFKGMMAHILGTTMPEGHVAYVCHHCGNNKCSNPNHLYFGTPTENVADCKRHGKFKSPYESTLAKYGYEKTMEMQREVGRKKKDQSYRNKQIESNEPVSM